MWGQTAVTLVITHSIFIKRSQALFSGLKRGFPDHKLAPQPQKRPNLAKQWQKSLKNLALRFLAKSVILLHDPSDPSQNLNFTMFFLKISYVGLDVGPPIWDKIIKNVPFLESKFEN